MSCLLIARSPSSSSAGGGGKSSVSRYVGPSTYFGRGGSGTGSDDSPEHPFEPFCAMTRSRLRMKVLVCRQSAAEKDSFVFSLRFGGGGFARAGEPWMLPGGVQFPTEPPLLILDGVGGCCFGEENVGGAMANGDEGQIGGEGVALLLRFATGGGHLVELTIGGGVDIGG